jgi:hypothetical protein
VLVSVLDVGLGPASASAFWFGAGSGFQFWFWFLVACLWFVGGFGFGFGGWGLVVGGGGRELRLGGLGPVPGLILTGDMAIAKGAAVASMRLCAFCILHFAFCILDFAFCIFTTPNFGFYHTSAL